MVPADKTFFRIGIMPAYCVYLEWQHPRDKICTWFGSKVTVRAWFSIYTHARKLCVRTGSHGQRTFWPRGVQGAERECEDSGPAPRDQEARDKEKALKTE